MKHKIEDILPQNQNGTALRARIREAECIGCTKCIQACPFDAILGAAKLMHSVISDECTGCQLCIAPCPVDCIDMIPAEQHTEEKITQYKKRFYAHEKRMGLEIAAKEKSKIIANRKAYIKAAVMRAKERRKGSSIDI